MNSNIVAYILVCMSLTGTVAVLVLLIQYMLTGLHRWYSHYPKCQPYTPRTAIIIPAWNEAATISQTLDQLENIDYPKDKIQIYIIDDGSTDNTAELVQNKQQLNPNIKYFYNSPGGLGKAHVLNVGLKKIMADPWAEAVLIMDADVLFSPTALTRMTRHLVDPNIGAVTAYIQEGCNPGNIVSRFIAGDFVNAQSGARRAQNVIGTLACLAGGAQLHSRANLELLGGQIDSSTLAEDTYTTFMTQINDKRAIFEPNALIRSREPGHLQGLWKQRFRWARGNIQISKAFRQYWFHPNKSNIGNIFFGLVWFNSILMPFFMILTSISLIALLFLNELFSWKIYILLGKLSVISYLFFTLLTLTLDRQVAKRAWGTLILFPGLISLVMLTIAFAPNTFTSIMRYYAQENFQHWMFIALLLMYLWVSLCMFFAWIIYRLDRTRISKKIVNFLLLLVGYGPFLCVVNLSAFIAEFFGLEPKWHKTDRLASSIDPFPSIKNYSFETLLSEDKKTENRIFVYELMIIVFIIIVIIMSYYFEL